MRIREWLALAPVLAIGTPAPAADDPVPISGDDFVVTGTVKIRAGTYRIADANGDGVIHVMGEGTKLDLTGVTLIGAKDDALPDAFAGVGVSVDGAKGVTVTGGAVRGFKIGVRVHDSPAAKLSGIDASLNFKQHLKSTVEREDESDWLFGHENDDGRWERDYGAGIALRNSPGAIVERCTARGGQNGVLLDRCDRARVYDGVFSFNSGWGVALWRTCDATICRNRIDFCVRGYSHGRYARGQDSAGILVFEQCSRNTFALNSATHGGDGFFLYAGNETLRKTGEGGCNDNVVWRNDFSHAVANGIEATFSRGNRFVGNYVSDCDYGVWAGYSSNTQVQANEILGCKEGVAIEHGRSNFIEANSVRVCGTGIHLWTDDDPDLAASAFGRNRPTESHANRITNRNRFESNTVDVRLDRDDRSVVEGNTTVGGVALNVALVGGSKPERVDPASADGKASDLFTLDESDLPGTAVMLIGGFPGRHRRAIAVDDWGPLPPNEARLFPARIDAIGAAKLSAVATTRDRGPGLRAPIEGFDKFEVLALTEGFEVDAKAGDLPATIVVRRKQPGFDAEPFEIRVSVGNVVRSASGTISSQPWDVAFFRWTKDPREDADAWKALLAGPPVETRRVDGLDFAWNAGAVSEKVGADRFATLATCEFDLPAAGKWRLATVSDDGIRVWVDGRLVIDDWTKHGPTPHDADLDLAAGKHAIRVEHFEIDGWAVLRAVLSPRRN